MVAQEQEASAIATYIKRVVEEETGEKYVLKGRTELVHPDDLSWFLHLPIGKAGWLDHVQQEDGSVIFESGYVYDAHNVIEFEYRSALKIAGLRSDLERFHLKHVREKYTRTLPKVVKFFNMAESAVSAANGIHHTNMSLVNDGGLVTVKVEIGTEQAQKQEALVRENLHAIRDLLNQVADWLDNQRKKSMHMSQIKRTHHKLLEETRKPKGN